MATSISHAAFCWFQRWLDATRRLFEFGQDPCLWVAGGAGRRGGVLLLGRP
jgi:hypothetical protein